MFRAQSLWEVVEAAFAFLGFLAVLAAARHKSEGSYILSSFRRAVVGFFALGLLVWLHVFARETEIVWLRRIIHYAPLAFGSLETNLIFAISLIIIVGGFCIEVHDGFSIKTWEPLTRRTLAVGAMLGGGLGLALIDRHNLLDSDGSVVEKLIFLGIFQGAVSAYAAAVFCAWAFRPYFVGED